MFIYHQKAPKKIYTLQKKFSRSDHPSPSNGCNKKRELEPQNGLKFGPITERLS